MTGDNLRLSLRLAHAALEPRFKELTRNKKMLLLPLAVTTKTIYIFCLLLLLIPLYLIMIVITDISKL